MTDIEIFDNLAQQDRAEFNLRVMLEENGGEITEEAQKLLDLIDLLNTELIEAGATDEIARKIGMFQDYTEQLKAERDKIVRTIKRMDDAIERRKLCLRRLMDKSGVNEYKGLYTIKAYDSKTIKADNKTISELYLAQVNDIAREFLFEHPDISIELKGSATKAVALNSLPDYYKVEEAQTTKIIKPRKSKA